MAGRRKRCQELQHLLAAWLVGYPYSRMVRVLDSHARGCGYDSPLRLFKSPGGGILDPFLPSILSGSDSYAGDGVNCDKKSETTSEGKMSEKRRSRVVSQPKGTIPYTVDGSDTLASIAALCDTTTSDLKRLNRLMNMMIFPGQVLYVPDKDYVPSSESSPAVSPTDNKEFPAFSTSPPNSSYQQDARKHDIPVIGMCKPAPGHAEHQSPAPKTSHAKNPASKSTPIKSSGKSGPSLEGVNWKLKKIYILVLELSSIY